MKTETYQYLYKRDKHKSLKIMGVIVALFGIGGLASTPALGLALTVGAVGLISYNSCIEVNFQERKFRMITAFGTKGFGNWESLPELKCVSVFKTKLVSKTYGRSNASLTSEQEVIQVNLATEDNKRIRLLETESIDEAFAFAKEVSGTINLRVWDATTKEAAWLN